MKDTFTLDEWNALTPAQFRELAGKPYTIIALDNDVRNKLKLPPISQAARDSAARLLDEMEARGASILIRADSTGTLITPQEGPDAAWDRLAQRYRGE